MARKPKKETGYDLIKKEQLRAKELSLSEGYRKDITRYQELEESLSRWRMKEGAYRNRMLTPHPIIDSPEVRAHIQEGRKLKSELNSSCDDILKKYSISRPCSLDLLKKIADGLEQKGLRHRDEIPVLMITPDVCKIIEYDGYQVALNSGNCFSIDINPRGSKTDILHYVSKLLDCCAEHGMKSDIRFRDERLRDLEIYRLRALRYTYPKIATAIGINQETARKAYDRGYAIIHGAAYKKGEKKEIAKATLRKDCGTCSDRPSCKKLCAEVEAYARQDWREEPKWHGLINEFTPDQAGSALPAKGKGRGKRTA